jgi:hypothetical protein
MAELFDVDEVLTFQPAEAVVVTAYTNDPTARVFLHVFSNIWPWHMRIPFFNRGNGEYWGIWWVQRIPAVRLAAVDMMEYGTLHTEDYGYDFHGWLLPYLVE